MENYGLILLVDDDEAIRHSVARLLERKGYQCRCAGNADEAVQALRDRPFDAMISDIVMPGNADLRVVRAAKDVAGQMPVFLVTGYPTAETAMRGIDLSVAGYLTKPFDVDQLAGRLKTAIQRYRDRRSLTTVRQRIETCLSELEREGYDEASAADGGGASALLGTIRTLSACLSELLELAGRSDATVSARNLCELLDCPQTPAHRQALVETIEVLKQTKDVFKSKALAGLRVKLEGLLGTGNGACCRPA